MTSPVTPCVYTEDMTDDSPAGSRQVVDPEWVPLSGGDLEARRPRAMCPACTAKAHRRLSVARLLPCVPRVRNPPPALSVFGLGWRAERALIAARDAPSVSVAGFQDVLPLEPVRSRELERLRMARVSIRTTAEFGAGAFEHRRRQAQMAARHELGRTGEFHSGQGALLESSNELEAWQRVGHPHFRAPTPGIVVAVRGLAVDDRCRSARSQGAETRHVDAERPRRTTHGKAEHRTHKD